MNSNDKLQDMKIALLQTRIRFKEKAVNLMQVEQMVLSLPSEVEMVVLPEMFTTGFCPQNRELAEPIDGETMQRLQTLVNATNKAIVGSFMCKENGLLFNRGFFLLPNTQPIFIDKGHLYAHGGEDACFVAGTRRDIVSYHNARLRLVICYDLRFPLWCRNVKQQPYDILLVVANWPDIRIEYWTALLRARAIENQAYVAGVNMVGDDLQGLHYSGHSLAFDTHLNDLAGFAENETGVKIVDFDLAALHHFREVLPLWKDMDDFILQR